MRVLLDEDVPVALVAPLQHLVGREHQIEHVRDVRLAGTKDVDLLRIARQRGYGAVVTNDSSQLSDPDELRAIARSGLHHVTYGQRPGRSGLSHALGALIAALPGLLDELEHEQGQRLVRIHGLSATTKRYDVINPDTDPPHYWPRRRSRQAQQQAGA